MCFKNGTTGSWSEWEPYISKKHLYLEGSINNTVYTIYGKFINEFGETESISDEIIYLIKDYNNDQDETDNNNKEFSISYRNFYIVIMSLTLFFSIIIIRKRKKIEM